jgi:ADP-ribose pyrophosphatase
MSETETPVKTLYQGEFLTLLRNRHWEYVARVRSRGAVFVVALTEARELVLVEQYRIPIRAHSIELPAGIVGDEAEFADEGIGAAAIRELEEETGYRGESAELLVTGPNAAGMTSEILNLVRVRGLKRVSEGGGVGDEDITVHRVPVAEVESWLARQQAAGKAIDPRIYMALWFAQRP